MAAPPRKSSATITLVLLGAAALAACGQDDETARRDLYASKEDCLKDWGDELKCEEGPAAQGSRGGHGSYFYGPMYRPGQFGSHSVSRPAGTVDAARPGSRSVGTTHVTRGGFGGSGHAHSGGG